MSCAFDCCLEPALRSGSTAVPGRQRSTGGHGPARYVGIGSGSRACTRAAGKLRLDKSAYLTVQPIYSPGFTFAGVGEPGGLIATTVLLWLTPQGTLGFWLTFVALLGLIAMHAVYWVVTHPVNKFWLQQKNLGGFGSGFFSFGANRRGPSAEVVHGRHCVTAGSTHTSRGRALRA